jgi:hypothetical protein
MAQRRRRSSVSGASALIARVARSRLATFVLALALMLVYASPASALVSASPAYHCDGPTVSGAATTGPATPHVAWITPLLAASAGFSYDLSPNPVATNTLDDAAGMIRYDPEYASRTILGQDVPGATGYGVTPGGRTVSVHASERITYGGPGRPPTSLSYVDEILDTGTMVRYDPIRDTIRVTATQLPGNPYVVVSGSNPNHIVTVMVPK